MILSEAEKSDLRARVLAGERLAPEVAKSVVETFRAGRFSAAEAAKAKKGKSTKKVMTDDELDADLDSFIAVAKSKSATTEGSGV